MTVSFAKRVLEFNNIGISMDLCTAPGKQIRGPSSITMGDYKRLGLEGEILDRCGKFVILSKVTLATWEEEDVINYNRQKLTHQRLRAFLVGNDRVSLFLPLFSELSQPLPKKSLLERKIIYYLALFHLRICLILPNKSTTPPQLGQMMGEMVLSKSAQISTPPSRIP